MKEKPDPSTDLEQRSDVHIKPQVSEARGDDLGASVVTVLAHLCHQQTWVPALVLLKICYSKKKKKNPTGNRSLDGLKQQAAGERGGGESDRLWATAISSCSPYSLRYAPLTILVLALCSPNTAFMASVISPTEHLEREEEIRSDLERLRGCCWRREVKRWPTRRVIV